MMAPRDSHTHQKLAERHGRNQIVSFIHSSEGTNHAESLISDLSSRTTSACFWCLGHPIGCVFGSTWQWRHFSTVSCDSPIHSLQNWLSLCFSNPFSKLVQPYSSPDTNFFRKLFIFIGIVCTGESIHLSIYSLGSLILLFSQYFKLRLGND